MHYESEGNKVKTLNSIIKKASILIVDDTPENLNVLSDLLRSKGYEVRPVPSGEIALKAAENKVPDLVLLDITMPGMNGFEVCQKFKSNIKLKDVPIIFISALSETIDKVKAFALGGVDYIEKPFHLEEVNARVETHLKLKKLMTGLEELVEEQVTEISAAQMSTIIAMAKLAQSRDDSTGMHLDRVREYCYLMGSELLKNDEHKMVINENWINIMAKSSALHDIGKVGIKDSILLKKGKLDEAEFSEMKKHSEIGAATLRDVQKCYPENEFVEMGIKIAKWHHEKWDGSGYPDGLKKIDIPLAARIMSIADVYDALKSKRCYKEEYSHERCCEIIEVDSGHAFDPAIVNAFLNINNQVFDTWKRMQNK
jgi:putative two-component system response regulator